MIGRIVFSLSIVLIGYAGLTLGLTRRQTLRVVLGCALLLLLFPSIAVADEPQKKVLLLASENINRPAMALINPVIYSTLRDRWKSDLQVYDEGLDNLRVPNEKYDSELLRLLQRKYEGIHLDLIFAIGPPALRFLVKHQGELFPNTPIVFLSTDQSRIADLTLGSNITGVSAKVEVAPTLDLALALHPQTQKVVVIAGKATLDQGLLAMAQKEFRAYEGKLSFTYLTDLTPAEMGQRLAGLPDKSIVIVLSYSLDTAGKAYVGGEVISLLSSSSTAPIYALSQTFLGEGILGGRLLSYEALSRSAAQMGLRILAGESPQGIPQQTVPSVTMVDWRQMRRWGINETKLPAGTIVLFKESSIWELYKWRIIAVISLCILEALLIIWLLFSRAKRRQAEEDNERLARLAEAERRRLDEVVSNVPGIVWEVRSESGTVLRRATFVSEYVEKLLGYSVDEWISTPGFALSIISEEDRERSMTEAQALFESGREGVLQFRWKTKDGRLIWVESQVAPVCDETGKPVGLRGVTMDITGRRLAEDSLRESEERLQQAISVARFGVFEHDHLTGALHLSPLTRKIHAWSNQDTSSLEELSAQVHPEERERFIAAVRQAHDPGGDGFFALEYRIVVDGGRVRWINARARTFFEGENGARHPVRTIGAELDITERKEAEQALQAAVEEVSRLKNQLQEENIYLQEEIKLAHNVDEIIGKSNAIKYVLFKIEQVCETDSTVMILGETGTGKELVARAIHSQSLRKDRPLVKVNCAALSASLIESELFGHEKGAFTGASARKIGRFELADGATLFLDEIGELPLELQAKLLRVIQEGEFERLGGAKTIKVDVRIIAATNRNLEAEIENGSFREDLWYRLNVFPITVPPLRQRREDIPAMIEHFVNGLSKKLGKPISSISSATLNKLKDYSWPGNVRELANVIERAVINAQGTVLHIVDQFEEPNTEELSDSARTLEQVEKEYIISVLNDTGWRIEGPYGAAKVLGLNPSTLRTRMIKLRIQKSIAVATGARGAS